MQKGFTILMRRAQWLLLSFFSVFSLSGLAQTNPTPQSLPYFQDFSSLAHSSNTYPTGWQGWQLATSPLSSFRTTAPTADRDLIASSSAGTTQGNIHNYNGKIGFLNTGSLDLSVCFAINTSGANNIRVVYDIMTIRNPYDGGSNTRINEITLQYRVGTSGNFTTISGIEYQNNTSTQTSGTAPQNLQNRSVILPAACNNQSVVQLRWVSREVSGSGSRPSFAVDNIMVGSPIIDGVISPNEYGDHTNGQNQQSSATGTWYMKWDDVNLYVATSNTNTAEGVLLYIDTNPIIPINGGANSDGTSVGQNYDDSNFAQLQFRADAVFYVKDGSREYRTANGS